MPHIHLHPNKPELLSPAGNMECFFAAVENGADAVYLGLKDFSARASADNFTTDEVSKAIAYARKRSVKVYIAINTLIKTSELERVVDCLIALDELQPDALIIQDLGLLYLIQQKFPHFQLHASTQMTIHNLAGVKQLERMGFKRVVLARELSINEINNILRNTSIEIEVFVHGALCYSYSGLCFFSSMTGGRSGNRGMCAQPCRMYYKSQNGSDGYLFSMKDLSTISRINELVDAGVRSFKIEGRMKSPEYVAVATHAYRQAIDGNLANLDDTIHQLKTVFSRETANSYLFPKNGYGDVKKVSNSQFKTSDMINSSYPSNIGSYAGEIIKSEKGYIVIRADVEIGVRDLLQVFENTNAEPELLYVKGIQRNGRRVFDIKAGDTASIPSEKQYARGAKLYLLSSQKVKEVYASKIPRKLAACKIPMKIEIQINQDGVDVKGIARDVSLVKNYKIKLEKGVKRVTQEEHIKDCFSRLGDTPFELLEIQINISDKLFVPLSVLNDIRRDFSNDLAIEWQKNKERRSEDVKNWVKEKFAEFRQSKSMLSERDISEEDIKLSVKIDRLQYLKYIPMEHIHRIYVALREPGNFVWEFEKGFKEGFDLDANKESVLRKKLVISLPVIMRDDGIGCVNYDQFRETGSELITLGFRQFQISNLGAMELFGDEDVEMHADYPLYCLNPLSAMKLRELGFCKYTLSPEDDKENLQTQFALDADVIIYQDTPLFTSETCVWANMKSACHGKKRCGFKQQIIENEYGDKFIALNDDCRTVVINEKPFSIIQFIPKLLEAGQRNFRVDLCYKDYTPEMIQDIFSNIQAKSKIRDSMIGNIERGLI
jgi:putative protease